MQTKDKLTFKRTEKMAKWKGCVDVLEVRTYLNETGDPEEDATDDNLDYDTCVKPFFIKKDEKGKLEFVKASADEIHQALEEVPGDSWVQFVFVEDRFKYAEETVLVPVDEHQGMVYLAPEE